MSAALLLLILAAFVALTAVLTVAQLRAAPADPAEVPTAVAEPTDEPQPGPEDAAPVPAEPPRSLEIGDPANPAVTITRAPARLRGRTAPIPLSGTLTNNLVPLLQHAPGLASVVGQAANTYVLTFAPDVAASLADGSLRLVQRLGGGIRPITRHAAAGQVVGHGWFQREHVANPATLSLFVWQALAYITAQHYLFEIDERLDALGRSIAELKDWLTVDYEATLESSVQYLMDLKARLLEGEITESAVSVFAGRLEDIEREAAKIHLALKSHLASVFADVSEHGYQGRRLAGVSDRAREHLREYERLGEGLLLALLCRGTAAQLGCAFLDRRLAARRIDAILEDSRAYDAFREDFHGTTSDRLGKLSSWWPFERTRKKHRRALLEELDARSGRLHALAAQLDATIEAARRQLADESHDRSGAVAIAVTLDDAGGIKDVRRLLPRNGKRH